MKVTIPRVHGNTTKEKIIRSLALMLVFGVVIWAFMKNNERVVDTLNRHSIIYDETKTLNNEQKKFIISFTRTIKDEFGLDCRIQIFGGDFVVPELDSKTMYIGLAPSVGEVELRFPAMMRRALGDEYIKSLVTENFLPSFEYDDWPMEIQAVLLSIFDKLTELEQGATSNE